MGLPLLAAVPHTQQLGEDPTHRPVFALTGWGISAIESGEFQRSSTPIPKPARDAGSLASPVEMMRHIVDRCPKTLAALGRLGADLRRACRPAVDPSAAYPVPQRRVIDTQLVGDLAYRFARRADDLHRVSFELIRELPSRSFPSQQDLLPSAQSLCRRQHALTVGNVRSLGKLQGVFGQYGAAPAVVKSAGGCLRAREVGSSWSCRV